MTSPGPAFRERYQPLPNLQSSSANMLGLTDRTVALTD
jgi:hypothetical protein